MQKTLIHQDKDNKHYQIFGHNIDGNIFYFHHLGRDKNPTWARVTIAICQDNDPDERPEHFQFDGVNCVAQANKKLTEYFN